MWIGIYKMCELDRFKWQTSFDKMSSEDIISLANVDYNQAKELFAINVTGCSLSDILSTLLLVPLLCVIYQELCTLLFKFPVYTSLSFSLIVL